MDRIQILKYLFMLPALLVGFTFHEFAHAYIACKLGDNTPKLQGRLTLNPLAHIDILGFIAFFLVGFGWAKPVQTNPNNYKNFYKDDLKVSIAGPAANLLVAIVFSFILGIMWKMGPNNTITDIVLNILDMIVYFNCVLFFLNLIPIPGFDGFHVIRDLFPKIIEKLPSSIYRYSILIFLLFTFNLPNGLSIFNYIVGIPSMKLYKIISSIVFTIAA